MIRRSAESEERSKRSRGAGRRLESRKSCGARPFIGVHFRCCNLYARAYFDSLKRAYMGQCPRCGGRVEFPVREGGSGSRLWSAGPPSY